MKGYPKWFSANLITTILVVLFLTGLLLTPTTLVVRLEKEVPWRLSADSRVVVAGIHLLLALVALAIVGALSSIHMRKEWNRKRNRASGITLVGIFVFLSLTGVGIYYFGNETLSLLSSVSHLVVGLLIAAIYVWHLSYKKKNHAH